MRAAARQETERAAHGRPPGDRAGACAPSASGRPSGWRPPARSPAGCRPARARRRAASPRMPASRPSACSPPAARTSARLRRQAEEGPRRSAPRRERRPRDRRRVARRRARGAARGNRALAQPARAVGLAAQQRRAPPPRRAPRPRRHDRTPGPGRDRAPAAEARTSPAKTSTYRSSSRGRDRLVTSAAYRWACERIDAEPEESRGRGRGCGCRNPSGLVVLRPLCDGGRYDLVLDISERLLRLQCKWASQQGNVLTARCITSRRTPDGYRRTTYSADEVDAIAAYSLNTDRCCLIPIQEVLGHAMISLRLAPTRNNQALHVRWARDYELDTSLSRNWRQFGRLHAR